MASRTEHPIAYLFKISYTFKTGMMRELGATSLSAFLHAFGLAIGPREKLLYLNPVMDMPEMLNWLTLMNVIGGEVRFIGQDLHTLMNRIKHPETLASRWAAGPKLTIWIAAVQKSERSMIKRGINPQDHHVGITRFMRKGTIPEHARRNAGSWGGDWWSHESVNQNAIQILFVDRTERSAVEVGISIPNTWLPDENMFDSVRRVVRQPGDGAAERSMVMPTMNVKHIVTNINKDIRNVKQPIIDLHQDTGTIVDVHGMDENGVSAVDHILRLGLSWHDNIFVRVQKPPADRRFRIPNAESGFELFVIPLPPL